MNRQTKLNKLKVNKIPVVADGKPFIDALDKKLKEFSEIFGAGVEIDTEELFAKLNEVAFLKEDITNLRTTLENLRFPDYPKKLDVTGLHDFIKALKDNKLKVDISTITPITELVGNLIDKVEEIAAPKQGQEPSDYIPMRRVMMVGKKLMYDDSFYTGGGGGGTGGVVTQGGEWSVTAITPSYATRIDDASDTTTYIGSANPGTATNIANWQIKKVDSSSGTSITFANGDDDYNKIWDDRVSYTYN